jgi:hypothetical protein
MRNDFYGEKKRRKKDWGMFESTLEKLREKSEVDRYFNVKIPNSTFYRDKKEFLMAQIDQGYTTTQIVEPMPDDLSDPVEPNDSKFSSPRKSPFIVSRRQTPDPPMVNPNKKKMNLAGLFTQNQELKDQIDRKKCFWKNLLGTIAHEKLDIVKHLFYGRNSPSKYQEILDEKIKKKELASKFKATENSTGPNATTTERSIARLDIANFLDNKQKSDKNPFAIFSKKTN